jgi:hypothetical protein
MNVEIEPEVAQFPEKEYINGIFLAVCGNYYNAMLCDWITCFIAR